MSNARTKWTWPAVGLKVVSLMGVLLGTQLLAQQVRRLPAYQFLRQNEDWSVISENSASQRTDFLDPIKYVPVNDSGSVWLSFGGHLWARGEDWGNFGFSDQPSRDDSFGVARLLFHTDVHVGKNVRFFVETKSAVATDRDLPGGRRPLDVDEADLQEVFVDVSVPVGDGDFSFRFGRQHLLFGKQRLVSPLPWGNSLRTFDGVSGILKVKGWNVHGFWTRPVPVRKFDINKNDPGTQFYGVYAKGSLPRTRTGLEVYWLDLDKRRSAFNGTAGRERRHTLGARVWGPVADTPLDYEVESAYQLGSVGAGDINASIVASQLGFAPDGVALSPRFFVGFDYASGDDGPGGDVGTFNQLFPLGHAYLGFIDTIGRQNIVDFNLGFNVKPHRRLAFDVTGHNFWRANEHDALYHAGAGVVRPGAPGSPKKVGAELDLTAKYRLDRHTQVILGYSRFFASDFIAATGPDDNVNFTYIWLQYMF